LSAASGMRRARGFTLIEMLVVIIAIGILAGFALDRLLPLIGRAQRAAFVQLKADLQTALLLEAADRITRGEAASLTQLAGGNPMTLLLQPPANYLGSISSPVEDEIPRATWYFDERQGQLAYRVGRYARFDGLDGPADRIELRVAFVYRDRDGHAGFDAVRDQFDGLRLEPVHAYSWPE
jgi:prepilin-type N-terminal cleavage/methylation domain-containing protein